LERKRETLKKRGRATNWGNEKLEWERRCARKRGGRERECGYYAASLSMSVRV